MNLNYIFSAIILGIVVAIPPGSVTIIAFQRVLKYGFRNSLFFTCGSAITDIFYLIIVYLGVAQIIAANQFIKFSLFVICGSILLFLSVTSIFSVRNSRKAEKTEEKLDQNPGATLISGIIVTLSNPMTIVGWLAVGGNFFLLWSGRGAVYQQMGLWIIIFIMIGALAWFVPLLFIISRIRHMINPRITKFLIIGGNVVLFCFGLVSFYNAFLTLKGFLS